MTNTIVKIPTRITPKRIEWRRVTQNEHVVTASALRQAATGLNHLASYRRRELFRGDVNLAFAYGGTAAVVTRWAGYFKTGKGAQRAVCRAIISPATNINAGNPRLRFRLIPAGGGPTLETDDIYWGRVSTTGGSVSLETFNVVTARLDVTELTEYELEVETEDPLALISCHVHEQLSDVPADPDLLDPSEFAKGQYVKSEQVESLLRSSREYAEGLSKQLFNHSVQQQNIPKVTGSTTAVNAIGTGGLTASDPHFIVDLSNLNTRAATRVTMRFAAKLSSSSVGTTAFVSLYDIDLPGEVASVSLAAVGPQWLTTDITTQTPIVKRYAISFRRFGGTGTPEAFFYAAQLWVEGFSTF